MVREVRVLSRGRLACIAAAVLAAAYLLFPVQKHVHGLGLVRPRFEDAVLVAPRPAGVVKRAVVQRLDRVSSGAPIFTVVGGPIRVRARWRMVPDPAAEADEAARRAMRDAVAARRQARMTAGNEWCGANFAARGEGWEALLCNAWVHRMGAESEQERLAALPMDVSDYEVGDDAPFEVPIASPVDGTVVSLWATPAMLIGTDQPVAEILPDGAPLEVLGVVPASTRAVLGEGALSGTVRTTDGPLASRHVVVKAVQLGRGVLRPEQVALLFPSLTAHEPSVVVRLLLQGAVTPADVDGVVSFDVAGAHRPRLWSWISR